MRRCSHRANSPAICRARFRTSADRRPAPARTRASTTRSTCRLARRAPRRCVRAAAGRRAAPAAMVRIAAVQAIHSNGVAAALVDAPGEAPGLSGYGGSEAGFIITFSNGLVAYLTGDTGMFGDMETIISRYYKPTLVVPNMSDTVTLGPNETVYMIKNLVRPRSVMPSHVNEQATQGGAIRAGTRVDLFQLFARDLVDVVVPVSDVTRSFDGAGRCIGCR